MNSQMSKIRYLHNLLESKQISCVELTNSYIDKINDLNKTLNAYVTTTYEQALDTAKRVDEKIRNNQQISLLEGIPMTLKDNICTKGIKTTSCSKMLKDYIPQYDATVWNILKENNAVLLGKTNMDEFAMGSSCRTSYFGGSRNPHNIQCVPGGSSGGVSAAVAGDIAVYGLGSDTGGSIRQPASFCGIVGIKPTYGSISRYGMIAYASSLDQMGPMCLTVEDTAIVFDAISKKDPNDSTSFGYSKSTFDCLNNDIKGLKIGIDKEYLDNASSEVRKSIDKVIRFYESAGAHIVYFDLGISDYALPVYYILSCAEAFSNLARFDGVRYGHRASNYRDFNEMVCKSRSEGFGNEVKKRLLFGAYVLSEHNYENYYKKALSLRNVIIKKFDQAFDKCDIMLSPTSPKTAFKMDYFSKDRVEAYSADICTVPVNIAGLPSVSVPCGFDSNGLPIGFQLVGRKFNDDLMLNVAYQYEKNNFVSSHKSVNSVNMGVSL